jgi:hypothetical protein
LEKGKQVKEYTISIQKANLYSLIFVLPVLLFLGGPYLIRWGWQGIKESLLAIDSPVLLPLMFFISVIIGIVIHELIHGIFWALRADKGWESIKFGIKWKMLTPYTHCKVPLKVKDYSLGVFMPGLILGILPVIIAIINGSFVLWIYGLIFTIAAGGDFVALIMLSSLDSEDLIQDHPREIGFILFEDNQSNQE